MKEKKTYYGFTTKQQRKMLFEAWESTGSVTQACRQARVSRGTFYHWKKQFDEKGYGGLEEFGSRVAHHLRSKSTAIEQEVIHMRQEHPAWGKLRIAQEMAKGHNWTPLISPNAVRRILEDAGLWQPPNAAKKKRA
jgi:transposase